MFAWNRCLPLRYFLLDLEPGISVALNRCRALCGQVSRLESLCFKDLSCGFVKSSNIFQSSILSHDGSLETDELSVHFETNINLQHNYGFFCAPSCLSSILRFTPSSMEVLSLLRSLAENPERWVLLMTCLPKATFATSIMLPVWHRLPVGTFCVRSFAGHSLRLQPCQWLGEKLHVPWHFQI